MKYIQKVTSFVPTPLLAFIKDGTVEKRFPAIVAFADVSGFTKMSEQLATIGKEGAEALTSILNKYFTQMISRIENAGGFVGKFGGDAMTIFFPVADEENESDVAIRTVNTMLNLQEKMSDFQNVETKAGTFSLGMKIGVASGIVLFRVVGPEADSGKEYLLAGKPLDLAAEAEHHGKSGQVILSSAVANMCNIEGKAVNNNFFRVKESCRSSELSFKPVKYSINKSWGDLAKLFIDPPVFHRIALGMDMVGEIRKVSVIFMSFTGLEYDTDDTVGGKLDEIYSWVFDLTRRYGGSINKVDMGDKGSKMIITFGAPTAHENDEELAVHCGLELVGGHEKVHKLGLTQRIGIATGTVFAGEVGAPSRQEYTVMGTVVNLAARQMAYSKPGQLVVDQNTQKRAGSIFEYSDPDYVNFKGIKKPLPTYSVIGLRQKELQKRTDAKRKPLIGKIEELKETKQTLSEVTNNNLKVLIIKGDAGIGKTRLAQEALDNARNSGFTLTAGEALSYAKRSPYLIWISVIRRLMNLPSAGGGEEALQKIQKIIDEADPQNRFRLPIIASVLGIECPDNEITKHFDAQLRQENLFDFILQYFKYLTDKKPLLLLFEDVQWIDTNSLALISYLIRNLLDRPILFLIARRSYSRKFITPHIAEIEKHPAARFISLKELDRNETEELVLMLLNAIDIDRELMDFIYDSSHGNISFTEQLVDNLVARNKIRILPHSEKQGLIVEKVGDLSEVEVPDTLSSLIMSQLDRLQPEAKLTVKIAAVIGRQFREEIVLNSYPVEMQKEEISKSIKELEANDIIISETSNELIQYIFKNLLTAEVAYDSLLFAHRREYHKRVGSCIEQLYNDAIVEWCEDLARHFNQSDDDVRASKYLGIAGDKATDLYANESAENYYTKALERTPSAKYPEQRFKLLTMRAKVYAVMGNMDLQENDLKEQIEITDRLNDKKGKIDCLGNLAHNYFRIHKLEDMKSALDEGKKLLETTDHPFGEITINITYGNYFNNRNQFETALEYFEQSIRKSEELKDYKGMSTALSNSGLSQKALGAFDKALEYYQKSLEYDEKIGNLKSEAINLINIGVIYHQRGAFDKALEAYEKAREIAKGIGSKYIQSLSLPNIAVIYQIKGERDRALNSYKELLEISRQMNFIQGQASSLKNIGTWYLEYGDFNKATEYYNDALAIIQRNDLKGQEPGTLLNIGFTYYYLGQLDKAKELLYKALEKSQKIKHKASEDYSRRYLGFVLLDSGELEEAEKQFTIAKEIAISYGSKTSIASAKVGLGLIKLKREGSEELIQEGIDEARTLGDSETLIKGLIVLAKYLSSELDQTSRALELLDSALKVAESSGYRNDVGIILPLMDKIRS